MMCHFTPPHRLIATALAPMEEANIMAPTPSDLMLEAPTSIEDLGATMKPIHAKTLAHYIPREAGAATPTSRSINPLLVTFMVTLMQCGCLWPHQK